MDFDLDDITTGSNTQGIDGLAIIVNQMIVQTTDDIDLLIKVNQNISVKFIIIQSKTSNSFNNKDIGNILNYTKLFFSDEGSTIFHTNEMKKFIELKDYIFKKGNKLKRNPEVFIYYIALGNWDSENNDLIPVIDIGKKSLKDTSLFSSVEFTPVDSNMIQNIYRKTKSKLKATFKFEKKVTMYSIDENEVGYSGVVPFREFKKLLFEESSETVKPVFENNIRDYLGAKEEVNLSIKSTLETGDINAFCMLNNGITIITTSIIISGDNATIEDYQIVNGCQTCNVLIDNMEKINTIDDLIIPIRIISTKNETLKNNITRATNNQTAIKLEQLDALSDFQKTLEEYYRTYKGTEALVYERRTGQYRSSDVPKNKIVSLPMQIKAVAAMFLNEPSDVSGRYGTVARRLGTKIFKSTDKLIIYYVSALALYKLEALFKCGEIPSKYRRSRYHIMMLFKDVITETEVPQFNSNKMDDYCKKILGVLQNDNVAKQVFNGIAKFIIDKGSIIDIEDRKCFERKETTEYLLNQRKYLKKYLKKEGIWPQEV